MFISASDKKARPSISANVLRVFANLNPFIASL
jgi:hypothetical protein